MDRKEKERIDREIKSALSSENSKVSFILSRLELAPLISPRRTFSPDSMLKAFIFMDLKKIKSYRKLRNYLHGEVDDRRNIGFDDRIPTHQNFSNFERKLEKDDKLRIDYIIKEITKISSKYEIDLGRPYKNTLPETYEVGITKYQINNRKKELLHELIRQLMPKLKMNIKRNSKYSKKEQLNVILKAMLENRFAHSAAEDLRENGIKSPASNTVLLNLSKITVKEIQNSFVSLCNDTLMKAKRRRMFAGRKFDVAIDYTLLHYYGDRNHPDIIQRYDDRGTNKYFGFITLAIVEKGFRFTAYAVPVFDDIRKKSQAELVETLIKEARRWVDIRYVYADRGFGYAETFRALDKMGEKYIIPIADTSRLKKILNYATFPLVVKDHIRGGYTIPYLCLIKGAKGIIKIATNVRLNAKDLVLISRMTGLYSKRWGIETSYRVIKRGSWVRTTSNNYNVRLFYFLLGIMIYNVWVLLNILMASYLGNRKYGRYYVILKNTVEIFLAIT